MNFLKLTLTSGETTFVNMALVYEIRPGKELGSMLFISTGGDGDCITVTEGCETILSKCREEVGG